MRFVLKTLGILVDEERQATWLSEATKGDLGKADVNSLDQIKKKRMANGMWLYELKEAAKEIVRIALHKEIAVQFGTSRYALKMSTAQWNATVGEFEINEEMKRNSDRQVEKAN